MVRAKYFTNSILRQVQTHKRRSMSTASTSFSPDYLQGDKTHFGFEEVPIDMKEEKVRDVFRNVADSYDVMNDFMSGGLHRLWKDELLNMTGVRSIAKAIRSSSPSLNTGSINDGKQTPMLSMLDVAGGTGDVAFRFLEAASCK